MTTGLLNQDVAYAVRQLRKTPGFTFATVLTLALGIGANLTVFLLLYGVLLRPLPFPHPERLVRVERSYASGDPVPAYSGTVALFLRRSSHSFESVAIYDYMPSNVNLVQEGEAIPLKVLRTTSDFFRVFAMDPAIGRGFQRGRHDSERARSGGDQQCPLARTLRLRPQHPRQGHHSRQSSTTPSSE